MTSSPTVLYLGGSGDVPARAHALMAEQFRLIPVDASDEAAVCMAANGGPFSLWATSACAALALSVAAKHPDRVQAVVLEAPAPPSPGETEGALSKISVPTLVVFGTRDRVTPAETGRVYREKMPNCNYVLVFDAGHAAAAERPEAFVSLVSDFLTRREAFVVSQRNSMLHP